VEIRFRSFERLAQLLGTVTVAALAAPFAFMWFIHSPLGPLQRLIPVALAYAGVTSLLLSFPVFYLARRSRRVIVTAQGIESSQWPFSSCSFQWGEVEQVELDPAEDRLNLRRLDGAAGSIDLAGLDDERPSLETLASALKAIRSTRFVNERKELLTLVQQYCAHFRVVPAVFTLPERVWGYDVPVTCGIAALGVWILGMLAAGMIPALHGLANHLLTLLPVSFVLMYWLVLKYLRRFRLEFGEDALDLTETFSNVRIPWSDIECVNVDYQMDRPSSSKSPRQPSLKIITTAKQSYKITQWLVGFEKFRRVESMLSKRLPGRVLRVDLPKR
jgi:hypothetical protein